ncbi:MAG TPA: S4 domain-containing protein [Macromonas sp.]|nr:S4 domain-containing protein [Macromonas sp.]
MIDPLRTEGERLAKRVAALQGCSRSEAERLIENGHVQVAGNVVSDPARRVLDQPVTVQAPASQSALQTVSVLWHKPAGLALAAEQPMSGLVPPTAELQPWHLKHLRCLTPSSADATGVALFVQDPRLQLRLRDAAAGAEQEWLLDVAGTVTPAQLEELRARAELLAWRQPTLPQLKLSVGSQNEAQTRLRLALKHGQAERIGAWLQACGLGADRLLRQHRSRIGRLALGHLAPGEWRLLAAQERL